MNQRTIRKEVTIRASAEDVWQAWTTTDGVTGFFAPRAHIELRVGGPYELYFMPDAPEGSRGSEGCKILSYLPREVLSFSWNAPPRFPKVRKQRTCVVLQFEDLGDGRVRVKMAHHGWGQGEEWDQAYHYFERAWDQVLDRFRQRYSPDPAAPDSEFGPALKQFAYYLRPPRPTFEQDATEQEEQAVRAHFEHLVRLRDQGQVIMAGRSLEHPLGIVVFEAADQDAARAVMENDPAVRAGVFSAELRPFRVALMRGC